MTLPISKISFCEWLTGHIDGIDLGPSWSGFILKKFAELAGAFAVILSCALLGAGLVRCIDRKETEKVEKVVKNSPSFGSERTEPMTIPSSDDDRSDCSPSPSLDSASFSPIEPSAPFSEDQNKLIKRINHCYLYSKDNLVHEIFDLSHLFPSIKDHVDLDRYNYCYNAVKKEAAKEKEKRFIEEFRKLIISFHRDQLTPQDHKEAARKLFESYGIEYSPENIKHYWIRPTSAGLF